MPLATETSIEQQFKFNIALEQFQAMLRDRHPNLSATFNYEQADRFTQAINENIFFYDKEDQGADASDLAKLLHNEILNQGERKNSATQTLDIINRSPKYDKLLSQLINNDTIKAQNKASLSSCNKTSIRFSATIAIASFLLLGSIKGVILAAFVTLFSGFFSHAIMYETHKISGKKAYKNTLEALKENPTTEIKQKIADEIKTSKDTFSALAAPVIGKNPDTKPGAPKIIFKPIQPL